MDAEKKSNLMIALLGILVVLSVYNTFFQKQERYTRDREASTVPNLVAPPASNNLAEQIPTTTINTSPEAQAAATGPKTNINFASPEHDFGTIKQNTENKHVFTFTNTGNTPLIINDAKGSCGCTVPNYPKEPIAPGKTGQIEVVYSPGTQVGSQMKTVSITANTEPAVTTLRIKANVEQG